MSESTPRAPTTDRNLLFGILALQMDFVTRDALIAAMQTWVFNKAKPLGDILLEQGALRDDACTLLEALVQKHLEVHQNDVEKSLAAVRPPSTVRDELRRIPDPDLQASLAHVAATSRADEDSSGLSLFTAGGSTSTGERFRILRPHARGGIGQVYVAYDEELHREVALKEIQDRYADHPQSRTRFLLEAEITGGLEHPGIVPVYGLGQYVDGRPFYAMRFIKGDSLKDAVESFHNAEAPGRDPGERALQLRKLLSRFLDVCNAVSYAHSRGVLHRDLKPGNIMLGPYGETLVVDWGLAKPFTVSSTPAAGAEAPLVPGTIEDAGLTAVGTVLGTPQYMSPEQAAGRLDRLGTASDVYSLGATLYYVLTGKAPFEAGDVRVLLLKVQRGEFPRPRRVKPGVASGLEAVCLKAMALAPEERYPSPRALADDVEHWLADEPVSAYREPWSQRLARWARRHRHWIQSGVATLVLLAAGSVVATGLVYGFYRNADRAREKAEDDSRKADAARDKAEEDWAEANQELVRLHVANGVRLMEDGDLINALPWLAKAVEVAERGPGEADPVHRVRWGTVWRRCPKPVQFWLLRGAVTCAAFSPDGRRVCTGTGQKTGEAAEARVWDVDTGLEATAPLKHAGPLTFVSFSSDGRRLVTASRDRTARVWDAATGAKIGSPLEHGDEVVEASFSPDGRRLITASRDRMARVWEVDTGKQVLPSFEHRGVVRHAMFSPDGQRLLTSAAGESVAHLWDAVTGQEVAVLTHEDIVWHMAFGRDGSRLLTASRDKIARVWDAATGKELASLPRQADFISSAAFSPDGRRVALAGGEQGQPQEVRVWDVEKQKPLTVPMRHKSLVTTVSFNPDGRRVLTAGSDGTARVWDAATGAPLTPPLPHAGPVSHAAFGPDGRGVLTASQDGTARVWDTDPNAAVLAVLEHKGGVVRASFSPDDRRVVTSSLDRTARIWEAATGQELTRPLEHAGRVAFASFSADGRRVVTASADRTARVWNAENGNEVTRLEHGDVVTCASFSADGRRVVTASADRTARVWNAESGRELVALKHDVTVWRAAFSPDGGRVVTVGFDHRARIWDVETGREVAPSLPHRSFLYDAWFTADGARIVSLSVDKDSRLGQAQVWDAETGEMKVARPARHGTQVTPAPLERGVLTVVWDQTAWEWDAGAEGPAPLLAAVRDTGKTGQIWDAVTGQPVSPPLAHGGYLHHIAFSHDGRRAVTSAADNTARVWDLSPDRRPAADLAALSEVLAGRRVERGGNSVSIEPARSHERWQALKQSYPSDFALSPR
jgi:WD40 repeat protein/serine/threonine protein kinase